MRIPSTTVKRYILIVSAASAMLGAAFLAACSSHGASTEKESTSHASEAMTWCDITGGLVSCDIQDDRNGTCQLQSEGYSGHRTGSCTASNGATLSGSYDVYVRTYWCSGSNVTSMCAANVQSSVTGGGSSNGGGGGGGGCGGPGAVCMWSGDCCSNVCDPGGGICQS